MSIERFERELKNNLRDFKSIKTLYKQIPNLLTTCRIIAPIPINMLFFSGNIIGALAVSAAAFLTDAIDGPLARHFKVSSQFGADLDAVSDKLLIGGIALPIVVQNPIMISNIVLEGLISLTNIKAKLQGRHPKSSMIGKLKTWILSLTIIAGYFTSIYNLDISLLVSALAITPALVAQSITLAGYIKTNRQKKDDTLEEIYSFSNDDKTISNKLKKSKTKNNEKIYADKKTYIEELHKYKEELINTYNENNEMKTVDISEEKGNQKTKNFPK